MNRVQTIAKSSRRYKYILTISFFSVPIICLIIWLFIDRLPAQLGYLDHSFEVIGGYTPLMRFLGFAVDMLKGSAVMYAIWALIKLFRLYEIGLYFTKDNVSCFKTISSALIYLVIAGIVTPPLTSLILTMNNPPGQHVLELSFQSTDLTALIVGGILRVIAGVMENAQNLLEEAELTI